MQGLAIRRRRAGQAGISLIETLVALALGLALVSVAFNLYVSNRSVFRQIEAMTRLQESASIAAALLENDLRHAAGVLCRKGAPMTNLLKSSTNGYEAPLSLASGVRGYQSTQTDGIVGTSRLAGDSISIYSANAGAVARVTSAATATSAAYTFIVDDASNFSPGTVALACDYDRAVLFQVTQNATTQQITFSTDSSITPGNCGVSIKASAPASSGTVALPRCATQSAAYAASAASYTFGPGSLVGKYSFSHWYIGSKTDPASGSVNNRSLRRYRMKYTTAGVDKADEEMVENVSDMQITYLIDWNGSGYPGGATYVAANAVTDWTRVIAVRMLLTLTSPERVGLAAGNVASAATYTLPLNVTIRARMPGVLRR
jgi:type IV pilus assembly protein PilW